MKFHATNQVKNSTEMTVHHTNMAESTVNTQLRPLQKIKSQIFYFRPYSSKCDFMSQSHAQKLNKHVECINMSTTIKNYEF